MSRPCISATLCTSYMRFLCLWARVGVGHEKDSGAVCFSQQRRKPAGISRLLLPSASYYFSKQVQSAHPGGHKPCNSCPLFLMEKSISVNNFCFRIVLRCLCKCANIMEIWAAAAKYTLDWFCCLYRWHCGAVKGAVAWNMVKFNRLLEPSWVTSASYLHIHVTLLCLQLSVTS